VHSGNIVKIQAVTIAQTTANTIGLSAGLNAGDVVVVDGQDKLQDGSKVNPTTAATTPSNAQNANGGQQPSQQGNTQSGAGAQRRTEALQPGHSAGKSR
jgi:multidrug efflux system membrane fusion protein